MTARTLATLPLALGLAALAGCSGGKDETDDTDQGTTDGADEPTAETGDNGPDYFSPAAYLPFAGFGYNADTISLLEEVKFASGSTDTPSILIGIGTEAWIQSGFDGNRTDEYCVVDLPLTDPTPAPWGVDAGLWYAIDYTDAVPFTNCTEADGYLIDPEWLGGSDIAAFMTSGPWGLGIGLHDPNVFQNPYEYTDDVPEGSFFGAYWNDPIAKIIQSDEAAVQQTAGIAYELDLTTDPPTVTETMIPASEIFLGNGVATAFYDFWTLFYYPIDNSYLQ